MKSAILKLVRCPLKWPLLQKVWPRCRGHSIFPSYTLHCSIALWSLYIVVLHSESNCLGRDLIKCIVMSNFFNVSVRMKVTLGLRSLAVYSARLLKVLHGITVLLFLMFLSNSGARFSEKKLVQLKCVGLKRQQWGDLSRLCLT